MGHTSCCAADCRNTGINSKFKFYKFPRSSHKVIQKEGWIAAVRKINGSSWTPKSNDTICSAHFVNNAKAEEQLSPSYIPTIFVSVNKTTIVNPVTAIKRNERHTKRIMKKRTLEKHAAALRKSVKVFTKKELSTFDLKMEHSEEPLNPDIKIEHSIAEEEHSTFDLKMKHSKEPLNSDIKMEHSIAEKELSTFDLKMKHSEEPLNPVIKMEHSVAEEEQSTFDLKMKHSKEPSNSDIKMEHSIAEKELSTFDLKMKHSEEPLNSDIKMEHSIAEKTFCDQGCEAYLFIDSKESSKSLICNRFVHVQSSTIMCEAETQTDIFNISSPVKISNGKQFNSVLHRLHLPANMLI